MTKFIRHCLSLLIVAAPLVGAYSTLAQAPADGAGKAAKGAAKSAPANAEIELGRPETAALRATLDLPTNTPAQRFRQIQLLSDLGRADMARQRLEAFLTSNPSGDDLDSIARQLGVADVFRFGQDANLGRAGTVLADKILEEYHARQRDPQRMAAAIKNLSGSLQQQSDGMHDLIAAGTAAVSPLVAVLSDGTRAAEYSAVKTALVVLDKRVIPPLLGVLETKNNALKAQVIDVLGRLESQDAVPQIAAAYVSPASDDAVRAAAKKALLGIVGSTPTLSDAETLLNRHTQEYFGRSKPLPRDGDGRVEIWHWDANKKQCLAVKYREDEANVALAGRLAGDLTTLFPDNIGYRRLYWTGLLEAAAYQAGLDKPVAKGAGSAYDLAKQQSPDVMEDVLTFAMDQNHIPAATVAAQLLGELGHSDLLTRRGAVPCPLVIAAAHPDRRLRYAAVNSVLALDPAGPFAGSSEIPVALGNFVRAQGKRRALVAHPNAQAAQHVAALLQGQGYQADLANNGRDAVRLALATPDYELILLSSALDHTPVMKTYQELRHDRRTALVPVALLAALEDTDYVKSLAEHDPLAIGYPQPVESKAMEILVREMQTKANRVALTPEERMAQAQGALDWFAALARRKDQKLFDIRSYESALVSALTVAELVPRAAEVLSLLGTAGSQRALVDYGSQETHSLANRQAAAGAFTDSVQKFGIRLTRQEILSQYARYNASAEADRGTQAILTILLDAIELPTKK